MPRFGEALTRQAGEVRRSHDLVSADRGVLGHVGIERVLALLKAGRIPCPDAPWWPTFLSELVRDGLGELSAEMQDLSLRGFSQHAFQQCWPAFTGVRHGPRTAQTRSERTLVNGPGRG